MTDIERYEIDEAAVLRVLGLDVRDPKAQAVFALAQRYRLDPILQHIILVKERPYVTEKGLLHVAHRSGKLDGIEVVEEGETSAEWWARVAVYRKDMRRPFVMPGRYSKSGTNKAHGPEMAVVRAECNALRRAFDIAAVVSDEDDWPAEQPPEIAELERGLAAIGQGNGSPAGTPEMDEPVRPGPGKDVPSPPATTIEGGLDADNRARISALDEARRKVFREWMNDQRTPRQVAAYLDALEKRPLGAKT